MIDNPYHIEQLQFAEIVIEQTDEHQDALLEWARRMSRAHQKQNANTKEEPIEKD